MNEMKDLEEKLHQVSNNVKLLSAARDSILEQYISNVKTSFKTLLESKGADKNLVYNMRNDRALTVEDADGNWDVTLYLCDYSCSNKDIRSVGLNPQTYVGGVGLNSNANKIGMCVFMGIVAQNLDELDKTLNNISVDELKDITNKYNLALIEENSIHLEIEDKKKKIIVDSYKNRLKPGVIISFRPWMESAYDYKSWQHKIVKVNNKTVLLDCGHRLKIDKIISNLINNSYTLIEDNVN